MASGAPRGPLIGSGRARGVLVPRFRAAVSADAYLTPVAAVRLKDPNVRPTEAARLRRLADRGSA